MVTLLFVLGILALAATIATYTTARHFRKARAAEAKRRELRAACKSVSFARHLDGTPFYRRSTPPSEFDYNPLTFADYGSSSSDCGSFDSGSGGCE